MSNISQHIDTALLTQLLRSIPGYLRDIAEYRFLRDEEDYAVIVVRLTNPSQDIIIKLAGPHAILSSEFERSAAIVQTVRSRTAISIFEVVAVDASYQRWPWRYLVTTVISGRHWSEVYPEERKARALYASLGDAVGQLHTIRFPLCGEIAPDGSVAEGTSYYEALRERAQRRIPNPAHTALFLSLLQDRRSLFEEILSGVLCHEDLNPSNLLVANTPGQRPVISVIDFDSAWAGCAESDLARLEFWRGMMGEGFWEAYGAHAPISTRYAERRPIYQFLWCLEYARSTRQHLVDTARICATLGIPPVTFP